MVDHLCWTLIVSRPDHYDSLLLIISLITESCSSFPTEHILTYYYFCIYLIFTTNSGFLKNWEFSVYPHFTTASTSPHFWPVNILVNIYWTSVRKALAWDFTCINTFDLHYNPRERYSYHPQVTGEKAEEHRGFHTKLNSRKKFGLKQFDFTTHFLR